jgi:Chromo (CHRromatin Organisation MOdifier) domain
MEQSHYVNIHKKEDPDIKVGNLVSVSNESQLSHLPKGRQKLAIKFVGPYKVTDVDKATSNYTLDIPDSKRFNTFHITNIKRYVKPHLDVFPDHQRRMARVVQAEEDLNLEVEKVIGHERRRNGAIRFLCKWEGFSNEDSTYRAAEDFKSSPYGIKVVKDYVLTFGEPPDELRAWVNGTDWIRDGILEEWNRREGTESATSVAGAQGAQEGLNVGKEDVAFFLPREDVGYLDKPYSASMPGTEVALKE